MAFPSPGWAVEIDGAKIDLDDLRDQLRRPFDPWIEDWDCDGRHVALLRSLSFGDFDSGHIVRQIADDLVVQIYGAMRLQHDDARPVRIVREVKFREDGTLQPIVVAGTGRIVIAGARVRGRAAIPGSPTESLLQRRLREASDHDRKKKLLYEIANSDNWFTLYICMERAERVVGAAANSEGWSEARQTANFYRHAQPHKKDKLPSSPPTFAQAQKCVWRAVHRYL